MPAQAARKPLVFVSARCSLACVHAHLWLVVTRAALVGRAWLHCEPAQFPIAAHVLAAPLALSLSLAASALPMPRR